MIKAYGEDWISAYCERVMDPNFKLEEKEARLKEGDLDPEEAQQDDEEELEEAV